MRIVECQPQHAGIRSKCPQPLRAPNQGHGDVWLAHSGGISDSPATPPKTSTSRPGLLFPQTPAANVPSVRSRTVLSFIANIPSGRVVLLRRTSFCFLL